MSPYKYIREVVNNFVKHLRETFDGNITYPSEVQIILFINMSLIFTAQNHFTLKNLLLLVLDWINEVDNWTFFIGI